MFNKPVLDFAEQHRIQLFANTDARTKKEMVGSYNAIQIPQATPVDHYVQAIVDAMESKQGIRPHIIPAPLGTFEAYAIKCVVGKFGL